MADGPGQKELTAAPPSPTWSGNLKCGSEVTPISSWETNAASRRRTKKGTAIVIWMAPFAAFVQLHVGRDAVPVFCGALGFDVGAAGVGFRIPFVGTSDLPPLPAPLEGEGSTSSISSFVGAVGPDGEKNEGMRTVRGRSFPLDAMFGMDICRERASDVWASIR
jgi:hypothetical protein